MVFSIAVDRDDAPFDQHKEPIQWAQWAKTHAPFESVGTKAWTDFVGTLPATYSHLLKTSSINREQASRVLSFGPPPKAKSVIEWAVTHGFGVTVSD